MKNFFGDLLGYIFLGGLVVGLFATMAWLASGGRA